MKFQHGVVVGALLGALMWLAPSGIVRSSAVQDPRITILEETTLKAPASETVVNAVAVANGAVVFTEPAVHQSQLKITLTDANASITTWTLTITGLDSNQQKIDYTVNQDPGLGPHLSDRYFSTITSIALTDVVGAGAGDTVTVVTGDQFLDATPAVLYPQFTAAVFRAIVTVASGDADDDELLMVAEYSLEADRGYTPVSGHLLPVSVSNVTGTGVYYNDVFWALNVEPNVSSNVLSASDLMAASGFGPDQGPIGPYIRLKWRIKDAGGTPASFTVKVLAHLYHK